MLGGRDLQITNNSIKNINLIGQMTRGNSAIDIFLNNFRKDYSIRLRFFIYYYYYFYATTEHCVIFFRPQTGKYEDISWGV